MNQSQLQALINDAIADIQNADFRAIREAYTRQPGYSPYALPVSLNALHEALNEQNWPLAGMICLELLRQDYLNIPVHDAFIKVLDAVGKRDLADWHRQFMTGLLDALFASGDGHSPQTAYQVIHIREEYDVLSILGLRRVDHEIRVIDGRPYDVFTVVNEYSEQSTLYFDVDRLVNSVEVTSLN